MKDKDMFDIKQLEISDSAKYHVTDAAGNPQYADNAQKKPVTITLASPGTRKAMQAQFKRDQARSSRVLGEMGGKTSKRTVDDEVTERAAFLAEITESLDGFDYPGGAIELYKNPKLGHVADGVEKFYNDRGNFSGGSVISSASSSSTQPG
jgi:hypothetical protein